VTAVIRARWLLSGLLIVGAVLFAVGVAAERNTSDTHHETSPAAVQSATSTTIHSEADERTGAPDATLHNEATATGSTTHAETGEAAGSDRRSESGKTFLGINLESTPFVVVAVGVSLGLAVLTWRSRRRILLLATAAFAIIFTVFDTTEVVHQLGDSRIGIAALAILIAIVHLAVAIAAEQRSRLATAT
jgi:hypothetical protein